MDTILKELVTLHWYFLEYQYCKEWRWD